MATAFNLLCLCKERNRKQKRDIQHNDNQPHVTKPPNASVFFLKEQGPDGNGVKENVGWDCGGGKEVECVCSYMLGSDFILACL